MATVKFRHNPAVAIAGLIATFGAIPVATWRWYLAPVLLVCDAGYVGYDLMLIPDGLCGERLRVREEAVDVARTFMQEGMGVAAIGHGPQVLISAGSLDGRRVTCSLGIRDDVRAAGASYRDEAVVIDGNLMTCRGADDLPAFAQSMLRLLAKVRV